MLYVDPKTKAKNGIVCDLCRAVHVNKFIYFSAIFTLVEVDCELQKTGPKSTDPRNLELDICPKCQEELINKVRKTIEQQEKRGTWTTKT